MNDQTLVDVLKWYAEMGEDLAIGAEPANWYSMSDRLSKHRAALSKAASGARPSASSVPGPGPVPEPVPGQQPPTAARGPESRRPAVNQAISLPDDAMLDAQARAAGAGSLEELQKAVAGFDGCALKRTAKNLCFADGNCDAAVMLIGEAPGRDEDLAGRPFVGRAGQLLDLMLGAVGLDRKQDVYITNTVYWRPPGNRTPSVLETQLCMPFVARQIALLKPKVIVLLGGAAAKSMLKTQQGITKIRGKWRTLPPTSDAGAENIATDIPVLATLHPAYLLRNPSSKRLAWQDFLTLSEKLPRLK